MLQGEDPRPTPKRQPNPMLTTRRMSSMANLRQRSESKGGQTSMQRVVSKSMQAMPRLGSRAMQVMLRAESRSSQVGPNDQQAGGDPSSEAAEAEKEETEVLVGRALFLLSGQNPARVFLAKASEVRHLQQGRGRGGIEVMPIMLVCTCSRGKGAGLAG